MFILRDLLIPLQDQFSDSKQGRQRKVWFAYTLLAVVVPFTSSMTSNLLRSLNTLFGLDVKSQRFYTFMASSTLPWQTLWPTMWSLILRFASNGRLLLTLDDSINKKSGKNIFACAHFHDHAARDRESSYPWSQCIVMLGLLKKVKSRWACLPLSFRFYMMEKMIKAEAVNAQHRGKTVAFTTKMEQAAEMIKEVYGHFKTDILIVTDSWFGNDGLWSKLERGADGSYHLLSRLRSNAALYDFPEKIKGKRKVGQPRKYGKRLGSVDECAAQYRDRAAEYNVHLYGKQRNVIAYCRDMMSKSLKCPIRVVWVYRETRYIPLMTTDLTLSIEEIIEYYGARWKIEAGFKEIKQEIGSSKAQVRTSDAVINHLNFCMMATTFTWVYADRLSTAPERRHKIRGRSSFAFSDVRRIITDVALSKDFRRVCPLPTQPPLKSFVTALLRMVA